MPAPTAFIVAYITTGITDVLDGLIARKFGYESSLGAKLDSISDLIFYIILLVVFIKLFSSILGIAHIAALMVIILVRLINIVLTKLKYKKVVFVHTYANKTAGIVIFIVPVIFLFTHNNMIIWAILAVVFAAAIDELLITIKYSEVNLNRKSFLSN